MILKQLLRYYNYLLYIFLFLLSLIVVFKILDIVFPLKINVNYSTVISASNGTILHAYLSTDDKWRMCTRLEEITPTLKKAILFKEDKYFYYHVGINPVAVIKALVKNIREKTKSRNMKDYPCTCGWCDTNFQIKHEAGT